MSMLEMMKSKVKHNASTSGNTSGGDERNIYIKSKSVKVQVEHVNLQPLNKLMPDVVTLLNEYESLVEAKNCHKQSGLKERLSSAIRTALIAYIQSIWDHSEEKELFKAQSESYDKLLSANQAIRRKLLNIFDLIQQIDNSSDGDQNTGTVDKRHRMSSISMINALQEKVNQLKNELSVARKNNVNGVADLLKRVTNQRNEYEQMLKQLDVTQDPVKQADLTKRINDYLTFEQMLLKNLRTGVSDWLVSRDNVKRIIDELDSLVDKRLRESFYFKHIFHILTSVGRLDSLSSSATEAAKKYQASTNSEDDNLRVAAEIEYNDRVRLLVDDIIRVSKRLEAYRLEGSDNDVISIAAPTTHTGAATAAATSTAGTVTPPDKSGTEMQISAGGSSPPAWLKTNNDSSSKANGEPGVIQDKLPMNAQRIATVAGKKRKTPINWANYSSSILRNFLEAKDDSARQRIRLSSPPVKMSMLPEQSLSMEQSNTNVTVVNDHGGSSETIREYFQNFAPEETDAAVTAASFPEPEPEQQQQAPVSTVGGNIGGWISAVPQALEVTSAYNEDDIPLSHPPIWSRSIDDHVEPLDTTTIAVATPSPMTPFTLQWQHPQDQLAIFDELPDELLLPKQGEEQRTLHTEQQTLEEERQTPNKEQQTPKEEQQTLHKEQEQEQHYVPASENSLSLSRHPTLSLGDQLLINNYFEDASATQFDKTLDMSLSNLPLHQENNIAMTTDNSNMMYENIGNDDMYNSILFSPYAGHLGKHDLFRDSQSDSNNFVIPSTTAFGEALRLRRSSRPYSKPTTTEVEMTKSTDKPVLEAKEASLGNPSFDKL